ncbi:GNAT family N-acetyltransferase [Bifidobacterium choloepi]|uniref:GNAT family N-acetyltransferase n=1 Tax=Bifidobacterium choloepi TaxID=2614131 RepID=A0A6I5MZ07_9BIFI|nr:GNAT family N-acetyltransferase [Bifidobacterium choloepi]NEG69446.1 GNAT family N-acetyltransferase [Bifidobacterium choloepi]
MADYPAMAAIYEHARRIMRENGNPTQWGHEFPRESVVLDDIANGRTMLLVDRPEGEQAGMDCDDPSAETDSETDGETLPFGMLATGERILAQFALCPGIDPTYVSIEGSWLDDDPYVTIHRIAASGLGPHAARDCLEWALAHYGNVRADTHPNNKAMQHVLETGGFARCGLIQLIDRPKDTTRIAYHRHEW